MKFKCLQEVKKPNGDQYAADSIFYLVLGIQEYLFEVSIISVAMFSMTGFVCITLYFVQNGRIDNIFTDTYYDPFTSALHEVVKDFKLPVSYFILNLSSQHKMNIRQCHC